jgi:hypothetical protein
MSDELGARLAGIEGMTDALTGAQGEGLRRRGSDSRLATAVDESARRAH